MREEAVMTPLMKKLKTLWLAAAHPEGEAVRFSRGLTIRSRRVHGSGERAAKAAKAPAASS